jgi:hypothetical protein
MRAAQIGGSDRRGASGPLRRRARRPRGPAALRPAAAPLRTAHSLAAAAAGAGAGAPLLPPPPKVMPSSYVLEASPHPLAARNSANVSIPGNAARQAGASAA